VISKYQLSPASSNRRWFESREQSRRSCKPFGIQLPKFGDGGILVVPGIGSIKLPIERRLYKSFRIPAAKFRNGGINLVPGIRSVKTPLV
jgi:hypothetical protein